MNLTLALPSSLREVSIDGELFVLVRRSALDALYLSPAAGDCTTRSPAARAANAASSRPARKKLKANHARSAAARPAAAPAPEISKPVSGALRSAVLAEIQLSPGRTSLEIFDVIRRKIPTTTSGSVYQSIKALVRNRLVDGQQTDEGTKGWHPAR